MAMNDPVRLQKFLSQCGLASRRKAEEMIKAGRVQVDGAIITDMGYKIIPGQNIIKCDGQPLSPRNRLTYILLNKPKGYVTTLSDPQGRPIVTSLLTGISERVFPVGRLDLDTEGALILTNDGAFAQKVQHPSHEVTKTYEALVAGHPSKDQLAQLENGVLVEGKITSPAELTVLKKIKHATLVQITIHEGRKRQVRKMFEAVAHPVLHLKRIAYGCLRLHRLPSGKFRLLNSGDLEKIFLKFPLQTKK
ncbi:pseudouridine synthase [Desulfoprunum benzoelyticum]|jgi:pseudouridine synthase|uniref:Pseudouridine synthase n=2 Tax=Desulfoprunum benzoelyticum TaxID=1506996 RepID=A0A840V147_9BACT|nr:pseudouridine synthase [Desulfoprunum benzoelyticum]